MIHFTVQETDFSHINYPEIDFLTVLFLFFFFYLFLNCFCTTKKYVYYIAQLTSVYMKIDVNKYTVVFFKITGSC